MKKIMLSVSMVLLVLLNGCTKNKQSDEDITNTSPTAQPTITLPAAEPTKGAKEDTSGQNTSGEALTVKDYYPLLADTEYVYAGEGNEFAFYNRYTDFLDTANNRIQTRTDNGGTSTVCVIEIKDGRLSVIKTVNECYYRDNFMDAAADDQAEVLLMEPLVQGTQWTLPDGRKRSISAVNVTMETPSGNYQTIEVTTQSDGSTTKDYYAPQVGLVKSVFGSEDMAVSSSLAEIKTDTPFTQTINIYYPDSDEKIYAEPLTLSFKTGDITRLVLEDAICNNAVKESYRPLASTNTKINSMYLGRDNIAYIDFSPELVTEMNAGSGIEAAILQCITNTVGSYYGTDRVYITIDGKPYSSGHILKNKGETFKVDMSKVIR